MVEDLNQIQDPIPPLPKGYIKKSELPPLPAGYVIKKKDGTEPSTIGAEIGGTVGTSKAQSDLPENKGVINIGLTGFMQTPVADVTAKVKNKILAGRNIDEKELDFIKLNDYKAYTEIAKELSNNFLSKFKKETGQDYTPEAVDNIKASQRIKLGIAKPGDADLAVTELVQEDLETNFPIKPKNIFEPFSQTEEEQVKWYNEIMTNPEKKTEYLVKRQQQEIEKESKLNPYKDRFSTESMSLGGDGFASDVALDNPVAMKEYFKQRNEKLNELNTITQKIDNLKKVAASTIRSVEMERLIREQGFTDLNSPEAVDYLASKEGRQKLGFSIAIKSDARLAAQLSDIEKELQNAQNNYETPDQLLPYNKEYVNIPTDEDSRFKSLSETGDEKIQAQLRLQGYNNMISYYTENGNTEAVKKLQEKQSEVSVENGKAYSDELWARLSNARFKDNNNSTTIGTFDVTPDYLRKLATQEGFTPVEMSILETMIKDEMSRSITSNLQTSGFVDNLFEALGNTAVNMKNIFRGDAARIREILNDNEGRKEDIGSYTPFLQELKQLGEKEKSGTLTPAEQSRKEFLLENTNLLNWWQQLKSGTADLTGQVVGLAVSAKGLDKVLKLGAIGRATQAATRTETAAATALGEFEAASTSIANNISNSPSFLKNVAKYAKDNRTLYVSSYTNSYDGYKKESLQLMPGVENEGKRLLYSNMMAGFEGISETIFNDRKVLNALGKEIKPLVREIVQDIGNGSLDKVAATGKLQKILLGGEYKKFIGNFLIAANQNASEEAIVDLVGDLSKAIVLDQDYDFTESAGGAFKTYYTTLMNSGLISGMAAKTDTRNNTFNKSTLYNIASSPIEYKDEANRLLLNGEITQQEFNTKVAIINKAEQAYGAMVNDGVVDKTGKNDAKNATYLLHVVNESVNKLKAEQSTDEIAKADFEKQAERSKKIREGIYTGKVAVDEFLNPVTEDAKIAADLDINQITPIVATETGAATIESAVIEINGKIYEGKNHAEAILAAQAEGQDISQVNRQADGKFKLSDGTIIDRAQAKQ
ncbi:MAG TPA: hypothetical protein DIC42_06245, partial [Holosporales bacterium]|nr:hypothetical protein [Holosporales bacterium]